MSGRQDNTTWDVHLISQMRSVSLVQVSKLYMTGGYGSINNVKIPDSIPSPVASIVISNKDYIMRLLVDTIMIV